MCVCLYAGVLFSYRLQYLLVKCMYMPLKTPPTSLPANVPILVDADEQPVDKTYLLTFLPIYVRFVQIV